MNAPAGTERLVQLGHAIRRGRPERPRHTTQAENRQPAAFAAGKREPERDSTDGAKTRLPSRFGTMRERQQGYLT